MVQGGQQNAPISPREIDDQERLLMVIDQEVVRQKQIKLDMKERIDISKEKNQSIITYMATSQKGRQKFKEQTVAFRDFLAHKDLEIEKLHVKLFDVEHQIEIQSADVTHGSINKSKPDSSRVRAEEEKAALDSADAFLQLEQLYTRVKFKRFDI